MALREGRVASHLVHNNKGYLSSLDFKLMHFSEAPAQARGAVGPIADAITRLRNAHQQWENEHYQAIWGTAEPGEGTLTRLRKGIEEHGLLDHVKEVIRASGAAMSEIRKLSPDNAAELQKLRQHADEARKIAEKIRANLNFLQSGASLNQMAHPTALTRQQFVSFLREIAGREHIHRDGYPLKVKLVIRRLPEKLRADPFLLEQALHNLIDDAQNHGDPKHPVIVTATTRTVDRRPYVHVTVSNRGDPIDRRMLRVIGREPHSRRGEPHGYGKMFARAVAEMAGGTLRVGNTRLRTEGGRRARSPSLQLQFFAGG